MKMKSGTLHWKLLFLARKPGQNWKCQVQWQILLLGSGQGVIKWHTHHHPRAFGSLFRSECKSAHTGTPTPKHTSPSILSPTHKHQETKMYNRVVLQFFMLAIAKTTVAISVNIPPYLGPWLTRVLPRKHWLPSVYGKLRSVQIGQC